jgi:hypothetical protein
VHFSKDDVLSYELNGSNQPASSTTTAVKESRKIPSTLPSSKSKNKRRRSSSPPAELRDAAAHAQNAPTSTGTVQVEVTGSVDDSSENKKERRRKKRSSMLPEVPQGEKNEAEFDVSIVDKPMEPVPSERDRKKRKLDNQKGGAKADRVSESGMS